jgi:hypothetical protein
MTGELRPTIGDAAGGPVSVSSLELKVESAS